jgi:hypothetical protein
LEQSLQLVAAQAVAILWPLVSPVVLAAAVRIRLTVQQELLDKATRGATA